MDKALKTLNLYMGRGPLAKSSVETLNSAFRQCMSSRDILTFEVSAQGLLYEDSLVRGDGQSPYYFYLFKDGVRELNFLSGLQDEELRTFLQILLDRHAEAGLGGESGEDESQEHDTVTMLWEADLDHLQYHAIDAYAAGEVFDPDRGTRRSLQEQVNEWLKPYEVRPRHERNFKTLRPISSATMTVDVKREPAEPVREKLRGAASTDEDFEMDRFAVVWARLVRTAPAEQLDGMTLLMTKTFQGWMDDGNWGALNRGLRLLQTLPLEDGLGSVVQEIVRAIAESGELERLKPAIESVEVPESPKVTAFFGALGERAVRALTQMIVDLPPSDRVRAFAALYERHGWGSTMLFLERLKSTESAIVIDAIKRLAPSYDQVLVKEAIRRQLGRPDPTVKYFALKALDTDGHEQTLRALAAALTDKNRELRAHAIKMLAASRHEIAQDALFDRVNERGFRALQLTERRLVLSAFVRSGGEDMMAYMRDELQRKSLFGAKKLKAWKDELQRALRDAGTPEARILLDELAED